MSRRDYLDSNGNLDLFQRGREHPAQDDERAKRLQKLAVRSAPMDTEETWADFGREAQLVALSERIHKVLRAAFVVRCLCLSKQDGPRSITEIEAANERADAQLANLDGISEAAETFLRADVWSHDDLRALVMRALDSLGESAK